MSQVITGTAGVQFDLTVTDTATTTGSKVVNYITPLINRSVTYTNASKVAVFYGQVGTTGTTIDLFALNDANDGTYYMYLQDATAPIALTSCLILCVVNTSANVITVQVGTTNSFLTASDQVTIPAGGAMMYNYGTTAKTVSSTVRNFKLTAGAINSNCEIFILGA